MQPTPYLGDKSYVETHLIAGPPAPSPPLLIAFMLVALSIAAPFVFLKDGTPSPLLGFTAVAVAVAGMITMVAAVRAQLRRRADAQARRRVSISRTGITLHPTPSDADNLHFDWDHISSAHLLPAAFIIQVENTAPKLGRYAVRFGKLITPRPDILAALAAKPNKVQEPG